MPAYGPDPGADEFIDPQRPDATRLIVRVGTPSSLGQHTRPAARDRLVGPPIELDHYRRGCRRTSREPIQPVSAETQPVRGTPSGKISAIDDARATDCRCEPAHRATGDGHSLLSRTERAAANPGKVATSPSLKIRGTADGRWLRTQS